MHWDLTLRLNNWFEASIEHLTNIHVNKVYNEPWIDFVFCMNFVFVKDIYLNGQNERI